MIQIIRHRLDGDIDMVQRAIERIKFFEPYALKMHPNGYYVAYSGGKDSTVIAELCILAGVKFELVNNHTTVDPPELVYHVRNEFKRYRSMGIQCTVSMPKETMWKLIPKKGPPTQIQRFCCEKLKEGGGKDRFVITGVRWDESIKRKMNSGVFHPGTKENNKWVFINDNDEAQAMMRDCQTQSKKVLNPIIDWSDNEVWGFIMGISVPYCKLYDEGFHRLGCIGCPMGRAAGMKRDFDRWPTYKRAYIRAFGKYLASIRGKGRKTRWETGQDIFDWWLRLGQELKQIEGQEEMNI